MQRLRYGAGRSESSDVWDETYSQRPPPLGSHYRGGRDAGRPPLPNAPHPSVSVSLLSSLLLKIFLGWGGVGGGSAAISWTVMQPYMNVCETDTRSRGCLTPWPPALLPADGGWRGGGGCRQIGAHMQECRTQDGPSAALRRAALIGHL